MSLLLVSFLFWGGGELERNSFIALPGEGGHSRLMPSRLCVSPWLGYGKVFFFSPIICISWRLITLQYCSGFCCTLTWISHDLHVFPILNPPPTSLSTRFLWVIPVHQPRAPVSYIQPGLEICFTLDNTHVSMLFSQIILPLLSPLESKSLFYTSVSLFLSCI